MANEKRVIDGNKAQAVLVNMAEHLQEAGSPKMAGAVGYAAEVIGKQPTVDAVEVVRCQDCKHSEPCGESRQCLHPFGLNACDGNDFCSYGERREGE